MRAVRLFAVVALVMVIMTTGAFAAKGKKHASVTFGQDDLLQCNIYCGGLSEPVTEITYPGTVSGCLADCAEICGSPCEIAS